MRKANVSIEFGPFWIWIFATHSPKFRPSKESRFPCGKRVIRIVSCTFRETTQRLSSCLAIRQITASRKSIRPNNAVATELPCYRAELVTFKIRSHQEEFLDRPIGCRSRNGQASSLTNEVAANSLDELFGDCMPRLFRVADCVLRNRHDSEDALQDGLLSALRHHRINSKGTPDSRHGCFPSFVTPRSAKLRKRRAHPIVSIDDQSSEDDPNRLQPPEIPADPGPDPERACAQAELSYLFAPDSRGLARKLPRDHSAVRLRGFLREGSRATAGPYRLRVKSATSSRPRGHSGIHGRARCQEVRVASPRLGASKKPVRPGRVLIIAVSADGVA